MLGSLAIFSLAYASAAALQKGLGFALFLWLAYSLAAHDYATFGLLLALQVGIATLAGAGISESVGGLLKQNVVPHAREQLYRTANGVFLHMSVLAAIVAAIVYSLPIWHTTLGLSEQVFVLASGLLLAFFTLQANIIRLDERHLASIVMGTLPLLFSLCTAFVAFYVWRDVPSFYAGTAVGLFLSFAGLYLAKVGCFQFSPGLAGTWSIRHSMGPYVFVTLLAWLTGYGNTYTVKFFFTPTDVATFTFAYTLSSVMHLVATSTNQVWTPRFLRLVHEVPVADLERRNLRFYAAQGLALGAIGGLILLSLPAVIDFLGGNLMTYRNIQMELFLLFAGYAVAIPWWHLQNYYIAHGRGAGLRDVVLATTIVGLIAWVALMGLLGTIGIYLGFFVQMLIRSLGIWLWARKLWPIRVAWLGTLVALVFLGTGGWTASVLFPATS